MTTHHNPAGIAAPLANYTHGVEVPAGGRVLFISGQVGMAPDGSVPEDAESQTELCFSNLKAVLAEAGMAPEDIVRLNTYITDAAHLPGYREARGRFMPSPPPASTLVIVAGLVKPEFKIEIEAVAARAG